MDKQALSDITIFNKYAKFIPDLGRRENWSEIVDRNAEMHKVKYPHMASQIDSIYEKFVKTKKVLPSMRSMQFGGKPVLMAESRIFNCAFCPAESPKFFSELMFLLLGGTGMGYSVQGRHIHKLPKIKAPESDMEYKFQIQDSIIGWSDTIKVVCKAFFNAGTLPIFDYRDIREKGADLITSGGKAPGPEPLRRCVTAITEIFRNAVGRRLTSLEVHDLACAIADSVLAGGIRRAAMICLFDRNDEAMLTAKSGTWYLTHPSRARANNSAVLPRGEVSYEEFMALMRRIESSGCGEPGVFWTNNADWGTNPCCISGDSWVMTETGARKVSELAGKDFDVMVDGRLYPAAAGGFWETGVKPVYLLKTKRGHELKLTADHRVKRVAHKSRKLKMFEWTELQNIFQGESIVLSCHKGATWGAELNNESASGYILGSLVGDGTFMEVDGKSPRACLDFWGVDAIEVADIALGFVKEACNHRVDLSVTKQTSNCGTKLRIASTGLADLAREYGIVRGNKTITEKIERTSSEFHSSFLSGLFDADGSIQGNQQKGVSIRLTQSCVDLLKAAQRMLMRLGINSSIYSERNPAGYRDMPNGHGSMQPYWCKEVHELVISNDNVAEFCKRVGFTQESKQEKLEALLANYKREINRDWFDDEVISIELIGEEPVFDVTVPEVHEFCANGIQVHNCEIALRPYQMCNLTEINAGAITDQESFNDAAEAASFIGTLQAGYTDFHYLNPKWKIACEKEALLGVSMTGIASGTIDDLDMDEAAFVVVNTNRDIADQIGINFAARSTTVKPAGTTSLVVGSSSGIHAWHAPFYIRRMRAGKNEALAQYMMRVAPGLVEDDVTNDKDVVLSFPQRAPAGAIMRDEPMLSLLERVKKVSTEWVSGGHRSGDNRHNVSCTISVKDDEWMELGQWMWVNRDSYSGISVLPYFGSDAYPQLPFEDITEAKYLAMLPLLEGIDISKVFEVDGSGVDLKAELACSGGVCDLVM